VQYLRCRTAPFAVGVQHTVDEVLGFAAHWRPEFVREGNVVPPSPAARRYLSKSGGENVTEPGVEPTSSGCMTGDSTTHLERSAAMSGAGIHRLIHRDLWVAATAQNNTVGPRAPSGVRGGGGALLALKGGRPESKM